MVQSYQEITFSFTLPVTNITLHEPVFLDLSVHNGLQESISFDLGHNRKSNFELSITEPAGEIVHPPRLSKEGLGRLGKISLKPDEEYTQRLLVNEWYQFVESGDYEIEIRSATTIVTQSGTMIEPESSGSLALHIHPRNPEQLDQVCRNLSCIAIESSDVEVATEAALALSYVCDLIAVPYLEKALREGWSAWQYVIPGLARIANAEAIEILISTMEVQDPESGSALARFALHELKEKVKEPKLKEKIERALRLD